MLLKKQLSFIVLIPVLAWFLLPESHAQITGTVTDEQSRPLSQVHITVLNTNKGTETDSQGAYSIQANPGDLLQFSHIGMKAEEIRVRRKDSVINLVMTNQSVELAEVEITMKRQTHFKTQKELLKEYPDNKNLIKTSTGILNRDLSSTWFSIIDGNDLFPGGEDFLDGLQAFCPHMYVVREGGTVKVYFRQLGFHWYQPLFDVDGILLHTPPTFLSAKDIDRIAVLERNAAHMRYGPQGSGGVIVINTKSQTWMDDMGVDRSDEYRLLMDSVLRVTHLESYLPDEPPYLEKLQKVRIKKRALDIAASQQNSHLRNPQYFLDMYDYFLSRWKDIEKSQAMSRYITDNFPEDVSVLKALAYLQQVHGQYDSALATYLRILMSRSWYAQSLRDVANAYVESGDYENAWMYYTQYINLLDQLPDVSYEAFGKDQIITTEMMNILGRDPDKFENPTIGEGEFDHNDPETRLVFEWNNPFADFELQFVSPEGYYDTWRNDPQKLNSQRPLAVDEYNCIQFHLGKENVGVWQINIDYSGNQSELPTYLKLSVYHNFGLPGQVQEVQLYKLSDAHKKVHLHSVHQN